MKALELATVLESDTADELLCQAYCDHMIDAAAELRRLAAVEAGLERIKAQAVPDEPDWRHPKIQGLIGSEARLRIAIDLIWQILEDPNQEFTASDMEYWDTIHDKLKAALSAAPAAQAVPQGWVMVPKEPTPEMLQIGRHAAPYRAVDVYRAMLSAAPVAPAAPQPAQQPRTIADSDRDFEQFWKGINPAGLTKRNLAKVAWRISHQQTKKGINSMKLSDAFDGSQAENLTVLDLSDKQFLRDLAAHAKERAECTGTTPAWAATYTALEASATTLADLIEQTEVEDV